MTSESEYRAAYYARKSGYISCLKDMFDELTKMHHDHQKYHRQTIDGVWEKFRLLEKKAREKDLNTRS